MIPLLFGAAALWGLGNLSEAERKASQANNINEQAAAIADAANKNAKQAHEEMVQILKSLGTTKMELMSGNINDVADVMGNVYKNFRLNHDTEGLKELEDAGFNELMLNELQTLSTKAIELSTTTEFITANNGAFCAIGALGGIVLGAGIIAAPAMLIYSFMKSDESEAALYEAKTRLDEAKYYEERSKNICALFNAITKRGKQIYTLLNQLNGYFTPAVHEMNMIKKKYQYDYKNYPDEGKAVLFYSWQIAQTAKKIIDTSMVHEDWSIYLELDRTMEIGLQTIALLSNN